MKKRLEDKDVFPDCKIVDEFVELYNNEEIKLKPEADKVIFKENGEKRSLTTLLGDAVTNYTLAKSGLAGLQLLSRKTRTTDSACFSVEMEQFTTMKSWRAKCLGYINYAKSYDLIMETDKLIVKFRKLEAERESLKRLVESLEKLNKELKEENDSLHKYIPNYKKKGTEIGGFSNDS